MVRYSLSSIIKPAALIAFLMFTISPILANDRPLTNAEGGYQITFPKNCAPIKRGASFIALCKELKNGNSTQTHVPATLPLLMVFREDMKTKETQAGKQGKSLKRLAAENICGSESLLTKMKIETDQAEPQHQNETETIVVTCPADEYGVIMKRVGHYRIVTQRQHRYHILGRYLESEKSSYNEKVETFIDSFKTVSVGGN